MLLGDKSIASAFLVWYDKQVYPIQEDALMKNWLRIAVMILCVLVTAACAEEAASGNVVIYFQDGSMVLLPAEIAGDPQQLSDYCNTYFPGRHYTLDAESATFNYDATISEAWAVENYGEGSRAMSARLVQLGLYTSVVANTQGEELVVPTRELTIRGFEDAAHHVAIVSAPRTGEASLRAEASGSSELVTACKAGRIVAVLEYTGASFTKILYDGEEGYIRTDCLIFNEGDKAPAGTGTIHVKGATDGETTVTVRSTASKSTAKVAALATGTVVTVHGTDGDWYLVEFDGWFGYVQDQYLAMDEN